MRHIKKAKRNEALPFPEYLDDRYDLLSTFCLQNWRLMLKYTPMKTGQTVSHWYICKWKWNWTLARKIRIIMSIKD